MKKLGLLALLALTLGAGSAHAATLTVNGAISEVRDLSITGTGTVTLTPSATTGVLADATAVAVAGATAAIFSNTADWKIAVTSANTGDLTCSAGQCASSPGGYSKTIAVTKLTLGTVNITLDGTGAGNIGSTAGDTDFIKVTAQAITVDIDAPTTPLIAGDYTETFTLTMSNE